MPPGHGGAAHSNEHHHGKSDRDLHDVISTLTHHLTGLGKVGSGTGERGAGIVTLAGSNKGAVMKAELLDEAMETDVVGAKKGGGEEAKMSAYTNSNYQAVNNSIMIDGRCEAEDPGVHIEIVDCMEEEEEEEEEGDGGESSDDEHEKKKDKKKKKKKKEEKKEKKEKKVKKEKKGSSHEEKEGKGSGSE